MALPQTALRQAREPHVHVLGETCPVCDRPIPNEKAQAVRGRIEAQKKALTDAANAAAAEQLAMAKARIEASASARIEKAREEAADALKKVMEESAAREAAARAAGKNEADVELREKLGAAERAKADTEAASQERIAALERERQGALSAIETLRADHERTIAERVQEAREALEIDKTDGLNAEKARHAVLSTFKFLAGAKQVEVRESVVIVNPTRAIAIAQIIRRQIVQVHALRLSKLERAKKMAALLDYITSPRCGHLLERIESHTDASLKLQEKEMKAHEAHWKQEGTLLKSIQKVKAELTNEIDGIIGTQEPDNDNDQA
jgi:hypothetical protein